MGTGEAWDQTTEFTICRQLFCLLSHSRFITGMLVFLKKKKKLEKTQQKLQINKNRLH